MGVEPWCRLQRMAPKGRPFQKGLNFFFFGVGGTAGRLRSVGVPQRFAFLVCYQRLPPPFYLSSLSPRSANDPKMISLSLPTLSFIFISFLLYYVIMAIIPFLVGLGFVLFFPLVPRSYPYCHTPFIL